MTSLLFVYVVFGTILHILIIHYQDAVFLQQLLLWVSFLNHFIVVSIHGQHHVASETGFKQDSSNLNSDSLIEYSLR